MKRLISVFVFFNLSFTGFGQMNFASPVNNPFNFKEKFGAGDFDFYRSRTSFVDIDDDGDLDCFTATGSFISTIRFIENVGTKFHPIFVDKGEYPGLKLTGNFQANLCFADLDADGDYDAMSLNNYFENIGTKKNAFFVNRQTSLFSGDFEYRIFWSSIFDAINYDLLLGCTFADIDGDGDLDFFMGGYYNPANIYFARNTGNPTNPRFTPENNNPFGLFNSAGESYISFVDFDADNDLDAVIGSGNLSGPGNNLNFFRNNGSATNPSFSFIGSNLYGLSMDANSDYGVVTFYDIDADGDLDAFLELNQLGTNNLKFYRNTTNDANAGLLSQSISGFNTIPSLKVGSEVYTVTGVTGGASGNAIQFTSTDSTIVKIQGNILYPLKAGSATIVAFQNGNNTFKATWAEQTVTVLENTSKLPQVINGFSPIPQLTGPGSTYNITGVTGGGSMRPIIFSSSNPAVVKVEGNQLIALQNGYVEITATQDSNNFYMAATPVTQPVQVGDPAPPLIPQTINGFPSTGLIPDLYPGQSFTITGVTGGASGNPVLFELSTNDTLYVSLIGNVVTAKRPKSSNISIRAVQYGNANYEEAPILTTRFKVVNDPAKMNQTITGFTPPTTVIEPETTVTLSSLAGGSSGNPVVLTADNKDTNQIVITGNTIRVKYEGNYRITATQAGSSTHNPATPIINILQVKFRGSKQYQQIRIMGFIPNEMLVGSTYTITTEVVGGASGLPVYFYSSNPSVISVSGNTLSIVSAGKATITAAQNGNASYYPAFRRSITINATNTLRLPQTISGFGPIPDQIVGNSYTITGVTGGASGNPIQFLCIGADTNGNILKFTKVGVFEVIAWQDSNNNYLQATEKIQLVRVKKIPQTIINAPTSVVTTVGGKYVLTGLYGGNSGNPLIVKSSNSSIASIQNDTIIGNALGTATISIFQLGDNLYENAAIVSFPVTVSSVTSVPNLNTDNSITIYPNPVTNGMLTIKSNGSSMKGSITITNLSGMKLIEKRMNSFSNLETINVSALQTGQYFVEIITDLGRTIKKLLVIK